jgi:hypothetical protein
VEEDVAAIYFAKQESVDSVIEKLRFPAPPAHRQQLRECLLMQIQPLAHLHRLRHHRDCEQVRVLIHQHAPAGVDKHLPFPGHSRYEVMSMPRYRQRANYSLVIAELKTELDYLRRSARYLGE